MADMTSGLLRAIEGFSGANAGKKEHEGNIQLLERVRKDIQRGKDSGTSTVGHEEAVKAASQKEMPAERGHSGGKGEQITNDPGHMADHDPAPNMHSESEGDAGARLSRPGPPPSGGHLETNLRGPAAASGVADIRRMAAEKEMSRPDTKFPPIKRSGDGNKESNLHGEAPEPEGRIGMVKAAEKAPPDRNKGGDGFEGVPPFAKEALAGDGFTKARLKAKEMYAAKK